MRSGQNIVKCEPSKIENMAIYGEYLRRVGDAMDPENPIHYGYSRTLVSAAGIPAPS